MMALRFKRGDRAVVAVSAGPASHRALGDVVLIHRVGPFRAGDTFAAIRGGQLLAIAGIAGDYAVIAGPNCNFMAMDWQLRKIDPPDEPESLRHVEDVEALA